MSDDEEVVSDVTPTVLVFSILCVRVLKLDKKGKVLMTWGKKTPSKLQGPKAPKDSLSIPHSIHLDETR